MSDKFLDLARQEIQSELNDLEQIVMHCNSDENIYTNSKNIKEHLHKIKGLAPMIEQKKIGEIARTCDNILKHIMINGVLPGSCSFMIKIMDDMRKIFQGFDAYDMSDFKKLVHDKFPHVPDI